MRKKDYKEHNVEIRQKYWKYLNEMIDTTIKKILFYVIFLCIHPLIYYERFK